MRRSGDAGYSLVEVLVGLLIFSIGALASGAMIVASMQQNQLARERSVASSLVSQRLEELRSRPWFDAAGGSSLLAGGAILSNEDLRAFNPASLDAAFSQTFDLDLEGPALTGTQQSFYLVMWRIEDMTDSGLDFKRITIKGVAMHWHRADNRWEPAAAFDHVAMIFREIKMD